jgi:hypothetical protein
VTDAVAERYVRLGLQLGRHVEEAVDAYFGPPELKAEVDAAPPAEPRALVSDADGLLDELEDGWLRDQVLGLRTFAGVLAGESGSYADEAEGYYRVRPTYTDEAVFTAAHEQLGELLPGDGSLAQRYQRWEDSIRVPTDQIEPAIAAVIEEARVWTHGLIELPDGEGGAASPSTSTCRCRPSSCSSLPPMKPIPATTRNAAAKNTRSFAAEDCSKRRW